VQPHHGDLDDARAPPSQSHVPLNGPATAGRTCLRGRGGKSGKTAQNKAEIFSPPYLFKGARPTISAPPSTVGYGQAMTITTPAAASITSVTLVKAGAVTHQIDADQRSVPLSFTKSAGSLTAQVPSNANFAPPGY
nr:DUF1929 domain-containing protein [Geodermatophilaceae bacterium]